YDALNKAISKSTGDVIGFMHSDDSFYSEDSLRKISDYMQLNNLDGVWSDLIYTKHDGKILRIWKSCPFQEDLLKKGWMPPHPTLYLKKSVYDEIGAFDLQYRIAADYDFIVRLFSSGKFKLGYLPELTVKMKHGGASNRSIGNLIEKSKEDFRIIQNHKIGGLTSLLIKNFSKIGQFL
ncbi:MAG: glycosyltransferase, partial [Deltaproteobacteria bacterium]